MGSASRLRETNSQIVSVDDAIQKNFSRGVIAGIRFVMAIPGTEFELLQEQFKEVLENERPSDTTT